MGERLSRRALVGVAAAFTAAWTALRHRAARALGLRPPGALPPGAFERACIRCMRCAQVCPTGCIRFTSLAALADAETPFIDAASRACILCMQCTEACPTGALVPTPRHPGIIQQRIRMGTPVLDKNTCLPWARTGVCRLCHQACPYPGSAITLTAPGLAPVFHAEHCVGCGLCEEACPRTVHAIRIVPPGDAS